MTIRMTIGLQGRGLRPPEIPVFGLIAWRPLQQFCTTVQTVIQDGGLRTGTGNYFLTVGDRDAIPKVAPTFSSTPDSDLTLRTMRDVGRR